MSKNGIRVEEFNIYMLGAEAVSYHLKDIHTLAMQVTEKNIGILCLELETELLYVNEFPFLNIAVARGTKDEPEDDRNITVRPTDWLVILWDEIHLFRDPEFRSTFSFDGLSAPPLIDVPAFAKEMNESVKVDSSYHAGSLFKSEGQEPGFYEENQLEELRKKLNAEYPKDGETTQIVPSVGTVDQEQMEVRTSSWSGKKVLMRPGVYDQLADDAKKMFGPAENPYGLQGNPIGGVGIEDLPKNPHNTQGVDALREPWTDGPVDGNPDLPKI